MLMTQNYSWHMVTKMTLSPHTKKQDIYDSLNVHSELVS